MLLVVPIGTLFGCGGISDLGCAIAAAAFSLLLANAAFIVAAVYAVKRFVLYSTSYAVAAALPAALCVASAQQARLYQTLITFLVDDPEAIFFYVSLGFAVSASFFVLTLVGIGFVKLHSAPQMSQRKNVFIGTAIILTILAINLIGYVGTIADKAEYEQSQEKAVYDMGFSAYLPRYSPEGFKMSYFLPSEQSDLHPAYYEIHYTKELNGTMIENYTIYEMPAQKSFNPPTDCDEADPWSTAYKDVPCQSLGKIKLGCELFYTDNAAYCQYKDTLITLDTRDRIYTNSRHFPNTNEIKAIFESLHSATADDMNAARKSVTK